MPSERRVLTINTGSSSLKAALYRLKGERFDQVLSQNVALTEAQEILRELTQQHLHAIGHRVVHGGSRFSAPERINDSVLAALRELTPIDPMHLPHAIGTIELVARLQPNVPQVACFDTAFHRTMPQVAQRYALPRDLSQAGVIRYGFHGLSYEYIVGQLRELDPAGWLGRTIVAHLGNGASMAAIHRGHSVETTMGFTPTGGLMMGTRTGDLDPGVLIHLAESRRMDVQQMSQLVNAHSGLRGVSGLSSDMRELLAAEPKNPHAAEAVELFCYRGRQFIGSLAAILGGVDTLVFTGGIGEHAAPVRWRMCQGLEFLGVRLNPDKNGSSAPIISQDGSAVTVRIVPTDEDLMIARHTARLLWS